MIEHQHRSGISRTPAPLNRSTRPSATAVRSTSLPIVTTMLVFGAHCLPEKSSAIRRTSVTEAWGLPIATRSISRRPRLSSCHATFRSRGVICRRTASKVGGRLASGVCPAICSIGAPDVVAKAAHRAFRSSPLGSRCSSPTRSGIWSGERSPASQPTTGQNDSSSTVRGATISNTRRALRPASV